MGGDHLRELRPDWVKILPHKLMVILRHYRSPLLILIRVQCLQIPYLNFEMFYLSLKVVTVAYKRSSLTRGFKYSDWT